MYHLRLPVFCLMLLYALQLSGQRTLHFAYGHRSGLRTTALSDAATSLRLPEATPLFSVHINGVEYSSLQAKSVQKRGDSLQMELNGLHVVVTPLDSSSTAAKYRVTFHNPSPADTSILENFVPMGSSPQRVYITGLGKHPLSRSHLFLPGKAPINIILPDNAWELGYSSILPTASSPGVCALSRRVSWNEHARRRRFETELYPDGRVAYTLWTETFTGQWQEGLRQVFQKRYLYDLEGRAFDETLYQRPDLQWIRKAYAMHLLMGWDKAFYDSAAGGYQLTAFLEHLEPILGGTDVVGIWPNWPMLGLDQRNQWDLLRTLPGGTEALRNQAILSRQRGTRFFISYNPWDESTRWEDHHTGMAAMIQEIGADGVVLDTEGKSSPERQQAADKVRPGVIMYSEGMAVPKDMPGIVSGRVHNALYFPPLLNLNKLIRPDFAIFRVAELFKEPIRREFALSFFNGYGTEINQFQPGRPDWVDEQYRYWGQILHLQRLFHSHFIQADFTPLYPTRCDSIYANAWPMQEKSLFTLFSLKPEGFSGDLLEIQPRPHAHIVDLWNHQEIQPTLRNGQWVIPADLDAFARKWLGTNNEGAVGAIAVLPEVLEAARQGDQLALFAPRGDEIRIWAGNPDYSKHPVRISTGRQTIALSKHFGAFEGKIVLQLIDQGELLDERVLYIEPGSPRLISASHPTTASKQVPDGMVRIPAGKFKFQVTYGDNFIPHPIPSSTDSLDMPAFFIDKHPVTNQQFWEFMQHSGYRPADATNFLKHWPNQTIPAGEENFPVVYVQYEDIQAYCNWAGKRLPSEREWQYAAQTSDGRDWPWSAHAQVTRESQVVTATLTVSKISVDSTLCNTGTGTAYPVGSFPNGANPFGLQDLTGCVWQFTNDIYLNGANTFHILKGGSYYLPASSWWYVEGGPRELTYSQKLMRIGPAFERNATTGFRCVKDTIQDE
ncbi:MAG: formylglycine-generating enzyme family protein [Haliscomenobacter sp.]